MKIGIVGASGLVGGRIIKVIDESKVDCQLSLFSRFPSRVRFRDKILEAKTDIKVQDCDIVFNVADPDIKIDLKPGAKLIDLTLSRGLSTLPHAYARLAASDGLEQAYKASALKACTVVKKTKKRDLDYLICPYPLVYGVSLVLRGVKAKWCNIATYQSTSSHGRQALKALNHEQKDLDLLIEEKPQFFAKHIAQNVLPCAGQVLDGGSTDYESSMEEQLSSLLKLDDIRVNAALAGVAVGDSAYVTVELDNCSAIQGTAAPSGDMSQQTMDEFRLTDLIDYCNSLDRVFVIEGTNRYITPRDCLGEYSYFISRMRLHNNKLSFWITCDNLFVTAYNACVLAGLLN